MPIFFTNIGKVGKKFKINLFNFIIKIGKKEIFFARNLPILAIFLQIANISTKKLASKLYHIILKYY